MSGSDRSFQAKLIFPLGMSCYRRSKGRQFVGLQAAIFKRIMSRYRWTLSPKLVSSVKMSTYIEARLLRYRIELAKPRANSALFPSSSCAVLDNMSA
jgi:hypothetical protein